MFDDKMTRDKHLVLPLKNEENSGIPERYHRKKTKQGNKGIIPITKKTHRDRKHTDKKRKMKKN